jgi:hypothetical protein
MLADIESQSDEGRPHGIVGAPTGRHGSTKHPATRRIDWLANRGVAPLRDRDRGAGVIGQPRAIMIEVDC